MIDLRHGDCLEILKNIESNSVDLVLSDPPYELGFMGKKWDNTGIAFSIDLWKEVYRVLKPGGYCMAFSGSRTYHRMAVAIEDAGFEIKDMIEWVYGSGFPKALAIDKALDKLLGAEREVVGQKLQHNIKNKELFQGKGEFITLDITAPSSDIAKQYEGYKTQLKPAHEPICLAMKPLSEKNFADNVMKWGTGVLNIDGTRIEVKDIVDFQKNWTDRKAPARFNGDKTGIYGSGKTDTPEKYTPEGRYPANLIISENIAPILDKQSDKASRFFKNIEEERDYIPFIYQAKASKKERNSNVNGDVVLNNNHTTVKPIELMKYLLKMGLPPYNSVVLDMFAGSGTTGMAIEKINRETGSEHKTILIERESEYIEIIKKRLNLEEE